ncbi:MAG: beta-hexosaminidase [Firmicutes bacterium]|nr:beta-hexosaminidase [Bacillota bacterium]
MSKSNRSAGRLWPVVFLLSMALLLNGCSALPFLKGDEGSAQEESAQTGSEDGTDKGGYAGANYYDNEPGESSEGAQGGDQGGYAGAYYNENQPDETEGGAEGTGSEEGGDQGGHAGSYYYQNEPGEEESSDGESGDGEGQSGAEASGEEVYGYGLFGGNPYEGGGLKPISEADDQRIREMISEMTLEEKVGQMFLARFPGADVDTASPYPAIDAVNTYHVGGFVLFAVDFNVYDDTVMLDKIDAVQAASPIPLMMAVDEEGGYVNRVSPYFRDMEFLSPRNALAWGGEGTLISEIYERCELLGDLRLNMNLYPVCDLSDDPADFIYDRAFSGDPDTTADYIAEVVKLMSGYKMACSLKHFPGYGNNVDTHTGVAFDERSREHFFEYDLKPFEAGIAQGAQTVMVSHNIVSCFDPDYPASISPAVHELLRDELGFEGVIVTDDLGMEGVKQYSDADVAVQAVLAGNDMLISTDYEVQMPAVMAAVQEGIISEERIEESVYRILRMKVSIGIL